MMYSHQECWMEVSKIYNRFYILMRFFNISFGVIFASAMFYFEGRLWNILCNLCESRTWKFFSESFMLSQRETHYFLHLSVYNNTFNTYYIQYRYDITISRKRIPQFWRFSTLLSPVEIVRHQQKSGCYMWDWLWWLQQKTDSTSLTPSRNLP